jgi:hypothetical protein
VTRDREKSTTETQRHRDTDDKVRKSFLGRIFLGLVIPHEVRDLCSPAAVPRRCPENEFEIKKLDFLCDSVSLW